MSLSDQHPGVHVEFPVRVYCKPPVSIRVPSFLEVLLALDIVLCTLWYESKVIWGKSGLTVGKKAPVSLKCTFRQTEPSLSAYTVKETMCILRFDPYKPVMDEGDGLRETLVESRDFHEVSLWSEKSSP